MRSGLNRYRVDELIDEFRARGHNNVRASYEVSARTPEEALHRITRITGRRHLRVIRITKEALFLGWLTNLSDKMRLALNR